MTEGNQRGKVPLLVPDMPSADQLLPWLRRIDEQRVYTNFGPLCLRFEEELRRLIPHHEGMALTTVNNATAGLELALQALGLERGARVLLPAFTFVASATAISRMGYTPLFADIDPASWVLTPTIARAALGSGGFDAVMPVAAFGYPHEVNEWDAFVEETGLPVIIDAAGALGNQAVGERTTVVFSLHATKSFGVGEGGVVASCDARVVAAVRQMANFGINLTNGQVDMVGSNAKMSEYHAAVGLARLDDWERVKRERLALAAAYDKTFADEGVTIEFQERFSQFVHSILAVRTPKVDAMGGVVDVMAAEGIATRQWYCPPLSDHPAFRDAPCVGDLGAIRKLTKELIGLPFYLGMEPETMRRVCATLGNALKTTGHKVRAE